VREGAWWTVYIINHREVYPPPRVSSWGLTDARVRGGTRKAPGPDSRIWRDAAGQIVSFPRTLQRGRALPSMRSYS